MEWFAQTLSSTAAGKNVHTPGTRLTQRRRYEGQGSRVPSAKGAPKQQSVCVNCGKAVSFNTRYGHECSLTEAGKRLSGVSRLGRIASSTPENLAKIVKKMNAHRDAIRNWSASDLPDWLDDNVYATKIQPFLDRLSKAAMVSALGISEGYAYEIARGEKLPHRRHWVKLAEMVGVGGE